MHDEGDGERDVEHVAAHIGTHRDRRRVEFKVQKETSVPLLQLSNSLMEY